MPTVTLLERQKRHKDRVNVYLDGEFAFGLDEMNAAHLHTGQQLSDAEITELKHKEAVVKAINTAVNLLSYRPRSTQEIRDKLKRKDIDESVIEMALERLQTMAYLDDRAFARFWIESRTRHKPSGQRALRYELRQKGVSDAIASELLEELLDEQESAYQAAQKRVRRMQGRTQAEFKKKIGSFLQRRGFGYEAANQALNRLIDETLAEDSAFFLKESDEF